MCDIFLVQSAEDSSEGAKHDGGRLKRPLTLSERSTYSDAEGPNEGLSANTGKINQLAKHK